jgi:hypothetical protein
MLTVELHIDQNKLIKEIKTEFNMVFPYLTLEFYRIDHTRPLPMYKKFIPDTNPVGAAGNIKKGTLVVKENMTVLELENDFHKNLGLGVQVFRRSGGLWLETTITDNWTLKKQNEHGREISKKDL